MGKEKTGNGDNSSKAPDGSIDSGIGKGKENKEVKIKSESKGNKEKGEEKTENRDDLWVKFKIEVPGAEVEKRIHEVADQYSSEVKLPGFRKGKVPVDIVKSRYKQAVTDEALNKVVEQEVFEKIRKEKIRIVSAPVVENLDYREGHDLEADIRVEVFPEVPLPDLDTLELEIPADELKSEDYDEARELDAVLKANKRKTPVKGRGVRDGDLVSIKYQSKILETGRMTPTRTAEFDVDKEGKGSEMMDLYSEILGKKLKDRAVFRRRYPKDYKKRIWAGKEVEHYVGIENIYEMVMPTLDEKFLNALGFKDEESFKKQLKSEFENYTKGQKEDKITRYMIDKLVETVDFPVPRTLVEEEARRMLPQDQEFFAPKSKNKGDKAEEIEKYMSFVRANAERTVKSMLIFDSVKKIFKLEVTNDDLEQEYKKIGERKNVPVGEVRKFYSKPEYKDKLKENLLSDKIMNFLKEKIKIKEV